DTLYARATRLTGRNYLGRSLVVLQFSLATFLIITTVFFYSQYNFLTHTNMGYDDNNLLMVTTGLGDSTRLMDAFRNEFARIPGVTRVGMMTQGKWERARHENDAYRRGVSPDHRRPNSEGTQFFAGFSGRFDSFGAGQRGL